MYDIICNPVSGKGSSLAALKKIENVLTERKIPYTVHLTERPMHATELTREINRKDHADLIVMGGDGTLNEVLNGIENFDTLDLGIISCGTGNDFIRAAKLPSDVEEALGVILRGNVGHFDYLQLGARRALNCAGAGMDVDVLVRYSTMKAFKGKAKYYASLIDTLIKCKFHKVSIEIDGKTMEKSVFMIAAANGTCIGGGMAISPHSTVDDGKMNVVFINEMPKRKIPGMLIKFLSGDPCHRIASEVTAAKAAFSAFPRRTLFSSSVIPRRAYSVARSVSETVILSVLSVTNTPRRIRARNGKVLSVQTPVFRLLV